MADNGYWWCHDCSEEVAPSRVTSSEFHDSCGHPCEWIEAKSVLLVERLTAELAKAKADLAITEKNHANDVRNWREEIKKREAADAALGERERGVAVGIQMALSLLASGRSDDAVAILETLKPAKGGQ